MPNGQYSDPHCIHYNYFVETSCNKMLPFAISRIFIVAGLIFVVVVAAALLLVRKSFDVAVVAAVPEFPNIANI